MPYRQIHLEIWDDPWFFDLNQKAKLLFIYLFSNSRTNLLGLYQISRRKISIETGLSVEDIEDLFADLTRQEKVKTSDTWIWIPKLLTRNSNNLRSPKTQAHIRNSLDEIPESCPFKQEWVRYYNGIIAPQYRIDTISIGYQQNRSDTDTDTEAVAVTEGIGQKAPIPERPAQKPKTRKTKPPPMGEVISHDIDPETAKLWAGIQDGLKGRMTKATYNEHFLNARLLSVNERRAVLGLQRERNREWVENRMLPMVQRILVQALDREVELECAVIGGET
jgi:hypothetical protein